MEIIGYSLFIACKQFNLTGLVLKMELAASIRLTFCTSYFSFTSFHLEEEKDDVTAVQ